MGRKLHPSPTPVRVAWLRQVQAGMARPPFAKGHTRFNCRALGWTEWVLEREGERLPWSVARARYRSDKAMLADGWRHTSNEALTPAGQRILKVAEHIGL